MGKDEPRVKAKLTDDAFPSFALDFICPDDLRTVHPGAS